MSQQFSQLYCEVNLRKFKKHQIYLIDIFVNSLEKAVLVGIAFRSYVFATKGTIEKLS